MKIIVTGGSGLVGKSLKKFIPTAIYLSSKDYDLTSERDVVKLFNDHNPDTIIHLAAKVGGILDNINKPAEYFRDNVLMNTNIIDCAYKFGVKRLIAILSTCIYPDHSEIYPLKEEDLHLGPPTPTNFSYGYAKRCLAVQIDSYNKQYGLNYQYLIPCNLYGENDDYSNDNKMHFITSLIKKIHKAKLNNEDRIILFGSGKPLRQFMHSDDLAFVINKCFRDNIFNSFNVATEENLSIKDIALIALRACDAEHLKLEFDINKPDGQFRKDVSIEKLKGIIPEFHPLTLFEGISKTYINIEDSLY